MSSSRRGVDDAPLEQPRAWAGPLVACLPLWLLIATISKLGGVALTDAVGGATVTVLGGFLATLLYQAISRRGDGLLLLGFAVVPWNRFDRYAGRSSWNDFLVCSVQHVAIAFVIALILGLLFRGMGILATSASPSKDAEIELPLIPRK